jgi:hypothetical protein
MNRTNEESAERQAKNDRGDPGWRDRKYPNGQSMFADDGTMLDEHGNRSIFDDVDE